MSEAAVMNAMTVFRILLVGGILLVLPLITRKGLLFGSYIGEATSDGPEARELRRRWRLGCFALMAACLAVGLGLGLADRPVAGNIVSTGALLASGAALYLWAHFRARALAPPAAARQAEQSVATLEVGEPRGATTAKFVLAVCVLAGLATAAYTMARYDALPERLPTHFGPSGEPDAWSDRSVATVMLLPTLNLVMSPFLALFALLTSHAKRSVRGGGGGRSLEAQEGFRAAMANLLSGTALFVCALMSYLSVQSVRVALSETDSLGHAVWWILGGMLVFLFGTLIRVTVKYGQGGARMERGSADAPLTDGLADDAHWVWGVFYVNRDDPSILVEKRFGIGYTINFGNRKAVAILASFLALTLGLTAVALIGSP